MLRLSGFCRRNAISQTGTVYYSIPTAVSIEWRDRQPSIAPNAIAEWERLADAFDPDALLAFHLADQHAAGADQVQELCQWQTMPRVVRL